MHTKLNVSQIKLKPLKKTQAGSTKKLMTPTNAIGQQETSLGTQSVLNAMESHASLTIKQKSRKKKMTEENDSLGQSHSLHIDSIDNEKKLSATPEMKTHTKILKQSQTPTFETEEEKEERARAKEAELAQHRRILLSQLFNAKQQQEREKQAQLKQHRKSTSVQEPKPTE